MKKSEGERDGDETPEIGTPFDRSAGVPPAVAGASRPRFGEVRIHDRGRLPHWDKGKRNLLHHVQTARFASKGSPGTHRIRTRQHRQDRQTARTRVEPERTEKDPAAFDQSRRDNIWTTDWGLPPEAPCRCECRGDTLRHFDNQRYRLFAWCVMPNHVHVVARIFPGHTLAETIHSWKSFTAKKANDLLELQRQLLAAGVLRSPGQERERV